MDVDFAEVVEQAREHSFWLNYLLDSEATTDYVGLHLAIFSEPFLSLVLSGAKTIDSRFSKVRCAPYGEISEGDIILIKGVGGPICGLALARRTWFFNLEREPLEGIRARFGSGICADDDFWSSRAECAYATLIELGDTAPIAPVTCQKRDRRGWVSLRSRQMSFGF